MTELSTKSIYLDSYNNNSNNNNLYKSSYGTHYEHRHYGTMKQIILNYEDYYCNYVIDNSSNNLSKIIAFSNKDRNLNFLINMNKEKNIFRDIIKNSEWHYEHKS